ncbi:MAG TPA: OmpA family protein [Dysgonamonadaceae bacterium]|nr:OmpA family protein [Dysgonamonadaceae bacterium]
MKKISLFLISTLVVLGLSAQEVQNVSHGDVYLKNKASSNWFMSLAGGTNMYFGSGSKDADFMDALGWQGQLAVGRWNSPKWGARLAINVGQHEHYMANDNYTTDSFVHPHLDLMWNVTNAAVGYRADRVYNFIPYIGVGYIYGMDEDFKKVDPDGDLFKHQNQSLTWNLGIINDFRLSNSFSIFVELAATTLQGSYGRKYSGNPVGDYDWDVIGQALVGVKFGLGGKQDFTNAELMDYNLINDLNSQINRLRAENENLSKRPEFCPECPEVETVETVESVYVPNVVFFRINSANIDRQQQISVYNTAEYLKSNPNATVQIVAYADRQTGTPDYNMKLSERRAKAVADALTSQYQIDSSRISLDWKGDTEQPYAENDWNRVAIFIAD